MNEQDSLFPTEILSCTDWPTNGDLIDDARQLGYITPADLVADITFGRGRWWTHFTPDRFIRHDLHTLDGIDFRNLPEADNTIDVVAFDPPYINTNTDASTLDDFADRFGIRAEKNSSFAALWELIDGGLTETVRILRPGGTALIKSMAYTNGRTFRHVPAMIVARLETLGADTIDELIHRRPPGPLSVDTTLTRSRRNCSTLLVARKRTRPPRTGPTAFSTITQPPPGAPTS